MFEWKAACLSCILLSVAAALPLHYGSLPVQPGADPWPVPLLLGLGMLAAAVSIIAGCVCCHRLGKGAPAAIQGFNNATYDPTPGGELTLFPPISAVSGPAPPGARPQFEPLPELTAVAAHPVAHPRPAIYNLSVSRGFSAKDWFDDPHRNFPRQQLKYQQELGTGWFGQSLLGEARNLTAEPKTAVVVKALRAGATLPEQMYFLHEMSYLRDANHANVLRLLGRCVEADPYLLILERCGVGDAKEFLQRRSPAERQQLLETMTLNKMAMDAAAGLQHLHDIHYTHSDLAARNCRVMTNCTLKIGDYGCNIDKYKEDYYVAGDVALPVRWCAPEILECTPSTIETKEITKASNVWSLGVLMWELLAFAALPYAPLSDDDVIQHVVMDRNVQLSRPKLSTGSPHTDRMYHVMQLCWLPPSQRPTVHRIHALLAQLTVPPPDDFEERWEALRPRGRADGGSDSESPEPAVSQPPSLDSELHDALRSLDRMLAAEETPADPTSSTSVSVPTTGGGDGTAVAEGDADGESGGGEESADEPGELTLAMRDQSRSVQDFLTLTAPLDSLEYSSERTESDPEQESALLTGEGREKVQDTSAEDRGVSIAPAPARPPVVGATHAAEATVPSPPLSEHASTSPPRAPLSAAGVASLSSLPQASVPVADGDGGGDTGDGGVGEASNASTTGEASDARTTVEDPGGGGGTGVSAGSGTPHAVPMVFCTEATPPRQLPTGEDGLQGLQAEEPAVSEPRAFRFVFGEKRSESGVAPESREESFERSVGSVDASADASARTSTPAVSEYFTAADSTLACADLSAFDDIRDHSAAGDSSEVPPLSKRLTSTPRGRRSPSFNDYIGSAYQTAVESPSDLSTDTVMGSRHSAPGYAPVAGDDVSAGSEAEACDAALLAGESRDDDVAMSELRRELRRDVERRGGAGDVPHSATVREKSLPASAAESPLPMSPIPADLSETAEHGSPPRSPSLSSTFGHSTCDELAELPDEEEVRSLCSRAELAPSKLWGSAEDPSSADRRCSADTITVIEAAPSRAGPGRESRAAVSVSGSLDVPGSLDVSPVLLDDLLGVDGYSQSSADVTPVMEEVCVLGKVSEEKLIDESEKDYLSSKMEEGTSIPDMAKSEDTHGEKSSVLEENLVTPADVLVDAEDALVKFENVEAVDKISAADGSVTESLSQAEQTLDELVSACEATAPEKSIADNLASLIDSAQDSTAKDSTLPKDVTHSDLESRKSENDLLIDFSTPRSEASVDVLRASTGVISSSSETSTLPSEQTPSPPTESSPSALITLGDDVLSSIAESPQIAGSDALLFGEKRDPLETVSEPAVDSAALASVTESQQDYSTPLIEVSLMKNEVISLADSSPIVVSEAVPVPGRSEGADECLVSLDGSGGFELTPGELTMPAATADGADIVTANFVPDDAETGADEAVTDTVRDAVGDEVVGVTDGRVAVGSVEVAVADAATSEVIFADALPTTAVSLATGEDASQKYRIGSEPEQLGANYLIGSEPELMAVDMKTETSEENRLPSTNSCESDRRAKYQVSPDSTTAATTAASSETLLDERQNQHDHQHHHQQQQYQQDEEEEMDEDNSFWDGLRRAAEQTQALMAEARRDSPQKTYRSMFLDGDSSKTSAASAGPREGEKDAEVAGAAAVDGAMTSWSSADVDAASDAANTAHDTAYNVDGGADGGERRSGHTRHGSGGFDTLVPSGGDPASAFERLALETELDQEVEIDLGAGDEEAAFAAIRAELRRALPVTDNRGEDSESSAAEAAADAAEAEAVAVELEEAGILCPPAVPGLETISEEGEEEEEDGAEEQDEAQDQIPDSWRDDFDAFVEVEIKPVGGVSGSAPDQQQPAASLIPAPAAEKQDTKSAPSVLEDVRRTDVPAASLDVKSQDGVHVEQKPAESNGQEDVEERFFDLAKRVEPRDVEARLVTEIQLTNADRFKPSTGVFGEVEGVTKWSSDVISSNDVMTDRGEPDGSHDVEPPAGASAEFGQNLAKSVGVSEPQQTGISSNGLGNDGSVENGLSRITHEDSLGEKQSLLLTTNGDALAGDIGDGLGDAGVGEVKAVTGEVGEAVGDTVDDLVKAEPRENGNSEDSHRAKFEVSKETDAATAKPAESESSQDADILKAPKIEFKIGEPASLSNRLRAASVEGAILIPGVGDVYSSLTSESLTLDAVKADVLSKPTAADFTSKPTDVTSKLTDATSKPTDVTSSSSATADVAASESSAAPARRAVSADLVAELKALASAAESRPPAASAGAGAGRGKTDRDAKERPTAAVTGPDLMLQDLESSPTSAPAARDSLRARLESPSCDSDASDVLEVDTESLEARLVEGGRPRSHVAFVLRSDQPLPNDNSHDNTLDAHDALDDAHAHPSPPEEGGERLQTRFDLSRSGAEVREDQSRTVSGGAWHEGEDSDYEGDYESLPVDVNGSGGAAAAGAVSGLTRSVASYNLSASAATPGWQGTDADADAAAAAVPDWQYPAPDSDLGAGGGVDVGGSVDAGGGAGVEVELEAEAEAMGQPASLPVTVGCGGSETYHVLSQGEMYHRTERRSSLPLAGRLPSSGPPLSASALTAEELDIDASIPTYDDVRRFGDPDDSLSSSDDDDGLGRGVGSGRGRESEAAPWLLNFASTQTLGDEETAETAEDSVDVDAVDVVDESGMDKEESGGNSERKEGVGVNDEEKKVTSDVSDKLQNDSDAELSEVITSAKDRAISEAEKGDSEVERGDSRGEGEIGLDESGAVLERPHRPVPGEKPPAAGVADNAYGLTEPSELSSTTTRVETEAQAATESSNAQSTTEESKAQAAATAGTTDNPATEMKTNMEEETESTDADDGVIFDRVTRPERPPPGARPPKKELQVYWPDDTGSRPVSVFADDDDAAFEDADANDDDGDDGGGACAGPSTVPSVRPARSAAPAAPEESRWSPEAPAAGGEAEAAFLDDDVSPWSASDAIALRERLQLINEQFSDGPDAEDERSAERAERLRRLNEQWGVPQPGEEQGRYTPDWEADDDDDEDDDGLSSTSGEFVWQEGGDRAAEAAGGDSAPASDSGSDSESESGEEEFTPSVWRQDREPGHGLLRSPERKSDLRKSVSFKRQKHHRIYEYPGAPASPDLGEQSAAQSQRKTWSFVAPAAVSHYTDWELDDEEIEDISLTELPESPDRQPPRLAPAAASHYFLSAGGDAGDTSGDAGSPGSAGVGGDSGGDSGAGGVGVDGVGVEVTDGDDDDEFYIQPGFTAGAFAGGSSFTPADVFPADEAAWSAQEEHAWRPPPAEGRFIDVWSRGGAGVAEEVVSPDVLERPIVGGDGSADGGAGGGVEMVTTLDSCDTPAWDNPGATTPIASVAVADGAVDLASRPGLALTEDTVILSESAPPPDGAETKVESVTAAAAVERQMEEWERAARGVTVRPADAAEPVESDSPAKDMPAPAMQPAPSDEHVTDDVEPSDPNGKPAVADVAANVNTTSEGTTAVEIEATSTGVDTDVTAMGGVVSAGGLSTASSQNETSVVTAADIPASTAGVADTTSLTTATAAIAATVNAADATTTAASAGAALDTSSPNPDTLASGTTETESQSARPARDKLFLDLTGAPADTVDSGYTGSCDDRTVAAFVALGRSE